MKQLLITTVRKALLRRTGPTLLLRSLRRTKSGRRFIEWMLRYYLTHGAPLSYAEMKIHKHCDGLTTYHYATLLDRLRKSGL